MYDLTHEQKIRVAALRAASRIVASRRWWERPVFRGKPVTPGKGAVLLAEQFAKWLEAGER